MAANHETSLPERNRRWYQEDVTEVNEPIRKLLENYSHVPKEQVVRHVNRIREEGFAINPYPCIGLYRFLNLTLLSHPQYNTILRKLRSPDTTYLDLGCCFGQDLRQLVFDGIPSERLMGLDIAKPLMNKGYDLFLDRATLKSQLVVADVFKGATQGAVWTNLEKRGVDVLHCSAFFHLFPLEQQIIAAKNVIRLVKKGGMLVGRQMGSTVPGDIAAIRERSYRHDITTLDAMWKQVGEATQTRWEVQGSMDMVGVKLDSPVEDANSRRLLFTITRVD